MKIAKAVFVSTLTDKLLRVMQNIPWRCKISEVYSFGAASNAEKFNHYKSLESICYDTGEELGYYTVKLETNFAKSNVMGFQKYKRCWMYRVCKLSLSGLKYLLK